MKNQMKTNSLFLTLVIGSLIFVGSLAAEPPQGRNRPPGVPDENQIIKMVDQLATNISLTKDQESLILDLYIDHFQSLKKMMDKRKGGREIHRQKMETFRNEFQEKVEAVLTDEQKKDYREFINNFTPERHRNINKNGRPGRQ